MPTDKVTPGSSVESGSPMDIAPERAHRACEKCTRTKKRCDKALPSCSRCTRLGTPCCYDFLYTAAMTVVEPGSMAGYMQGSKSAEVPLARPAPKHNVFSAGFEVPADMIMSLLTSNQVNWQQSSDIYFRTLNPSMSVVHPELFARVVEGLGPNDTPKDPELALLLVCMWLVTQYTDTTTPLLSEGKEMVGLPAYIVTKRVFGMLRSLSPPSILLVQCAILLCLFEFGHGNMTRAYSSIGDANTMASLLGLRPGKYVHTEKDSPVAPEDEEKRSLYWVLFIVDRLIHVESDLMNLPLQVASPTPDDLLPTISVAWGRDSETFARTTERHRADVSPSVPLGSFQRISQCAILLTRALQWEAESYETNLPPSVESFSELESATRALIEAMLLQSSTSWGDYYECFATCTCLLLLLYGRFLRFIPSSTVHSTTNDVQVLKAIAGINFTVRIINDTTSDLNDHLARRPDLLAPCSPVTPYSAYHCLRVLSDFEHVIPHADARFHDIYSSLHFFAKRWGVAGQLVKRIETWLADKDFTETAPSESSAPLNGDFSGSGPFS